MSEDRRLDASELEERFTAFLAFVSSDRSRKPYPWQLRLIRRVAESGKWPRALIAPTGSGKTIVIEVHLFLQALAGLGLVPAPPRRLALLVNRRALVDSQYIHACSVMRQISGLLAENSIAQELAEGLVRRGALPETPGSTESRTLGERLRSAVQIVNLRGGQPQPNELSREWRVHPERVSVLCMTPEMFGSRLLFRGYGVGRGARPIEAGLLAYDTVAVVDEAHLSRQLLITARQVPRIEASATMALPVPPLQTVLSTATPSWDAKEGDFERSAVAVTEEDLNADAQLRRRVRTPKPVTLVNLPDVLRHRTGIEAIVEDARRLRSALGGPIGVMVNSVSAAVQVSTRLREVCSDPDQVVTVVGRMRGEDRTALLEKHAALFSDKGDTSVEFVVGTQTLEVGLDLSFRGLVTELAPAAALAQRAGRVNRFAAWPDGPVHVCIPPLESGDNESKRVGVYAVSDLRDAVDWLGSLPDDEGITPWAVATHAPAPVLPSRLTFQRLEWADVENLSETGDDPAAEHRIGESGPAGVSLWIDDDLEPDVDVRVAVRRLSASGIDQFDTRLLSLTPVLDEETAPVPIRQLFARLHQPGGLGRAFLVRGEDDIIPLLGDLTVAPGDTILLDERAATFTDGVFDPAGESTLRDVYADAVDRRNRMASSEDVLPFWGVRSVCPRGGMDPDAGGDLARTDLIALATALRSATLDDDLADAHAGKSDPLSVLREWLLEHPAPKAAPSERRGTTLLSLRQIAEQRQLDEILDGRAVVDVVSSDDLDEEFTIVFTRAPRLGVARLETTTFRREPVLLRDHECDVARRAQELAEACGLSEFAGALESAGNLHDEGKRDPRFQRMLRYKDPGLLSLERASDEPRILAKSRSGSKTGEQAFRARLGLRGWRHEQLSAVIAWEKLNEEQPLERELVVRLAGTSHGHGRILFPDGSTSLLAGWDQTSEGDAYRESLKEGARHLFDDGGWDSLIERTGRRYGFWGVSYLEAVLRAADVQISELGGVLGGAGRQCRSRRGGVQHE